MAENFLIREGRPDELDEIVALVKTAYSEFKRYFPEEHWEAWMENIREIVHAGAGVLIVAEEQGKIRGVVKFYPFANQARMGHWPRPASAMRILAVDPGSRGQGLRHLAHQGMHKPGPGLKDPPDVPLHRHLHGGGPPPL